MGGQRSLRSYWRNYFESTDGLVWVVDSADRRRLGDCKKELQSLLVQEVHMWSAVMVMLEGGVGVMPERGQGMPEGIWEGNVGPSVSGTLLQDPY